MAKRKKRTVNPLSEKQKNQYKIMQENGQYKLMGMKRGKMKLLIEGPEAFAEMGRKSKRGTARRKE